MSTVLLVCAVLASLASGVLLAYAICLGMFKVFRVHSLQTEQARIEKASSMVIVAESATH